MKICHLSSVHIPFDTRIFHKECRSLAEEGHEVHLIVRHERDEIVDGIHIHAIPSSRNKIRRVLGATLDVYRRAMEERYDVCHFHDPELIPAGLLLKARGRTVVYDAHEDYPVYFRSKEAFPPILRVPFSFAIAVLERIAAPIFDAVVTVTPTIQRRFERMNKNSVLVCNFPFAEEAASTGDGAPDADDKAAVVYVGSLTMDRGIREMIQAIGIAHERMPVQFMLAGDFGGADNEAKVKSLPEYAFVDYRGRTTLEQTRELYKKARAGLVLLHPNANYKDAYPTKLFEYMAAGLPVVASDFPLWRSIVDSAKCGICVDPLNPTAIAGAILRLMRNPVEAREMGVRGRQAVIDTYNWEHERVKLAGLYDRLSRKKRR